MHDNMAETVFHKNRLSEEFPISYGLKQICILTPGLFSLYVFAGVHRLPPENPGVVIRYRFDMDLDVMHHILQLQYADDIYHSKEEL